MRPLGGWLFGWIADPHGRKTSMMISVLMMCAGSLMIAVMPTYATIGALAPGAAAGRAPHPGPLGRRRIRHRRDLHERGRLKGKRGFYSSFQYVTLIGGQLLAMLVLVVLQAILTSDELKAWGWRIPFVIGAVAAVVAMLLRRSLAETATAEAHAQQGGRHR